MNILSVASILPIHGVVAYNDFVLQTYQTYQKRYPEDRVVIIKPVKIELSPVRLIKRQTILQRLKRRRSMEIEGFRVEILPFFSFYSFRNLHVQFTRSLYYLNRKRIRSLYSEFAFDVVHGQYIYPDGMLASMLSKRFKTPYLITTHNERYFFNRISSRRVTIELLKGASMVVPLNHTNHTYFKSLGIDHSEFLPLGFRDEFIRDQKPLNGGTIRIFTASVLIELKNVDKVIRAMERLVKKHAVTYTIIGNGPEKARLLSLVDTLHLADHVEFLDHVPHHRMADEMYRHDIMIMPSYFETFGRVYFESMAMGIPIICARNSGISGFFREREEGISVDHRSVDQITGELEYLITQPADRQKIGLKGQALVKRYTWDQVAVDLHEKYERCHSEIE